VVPRSIWGKGRCSHDHPESQRHRLSLTSSSRATAVTSYSRVAPPQHSAPVRARHGHTTHTTPTLQSGATTIRLKKVESGARAPLGKEEPAGKEGHVVGWPAMLDSCSMHQQAGGVDGEPGRGVGERSREKERAVAWHTKARSCCLALSAKKNES
jgi:hypothetical protein